MTIDGSQVKGQKSIKRQIAFFKNSLLNSSNLYKLSSNEKSKESGKESEWVLKVTPMFA